MSDMELADRLVEALNGVHGEHPGSRAAHAKGICAEGTFTAGAAARELTRAAHMQGAPVPVTVRFSNGSGAPTRPDYAGDGRGMAVKFELPDGTVTDMVGLTLSVFFVRTPEDFLGFLAATTPDPDTRQVDLARVDAFLQEHPETRAAVESEFNQPHPESYASLPYNGIHTFKAISADGEERWFRYRWEPAAGVSAITKDEARERGRDYLRDGLAEHLPATFILYWYLGEPGDSIIDPTQAWPADRHRVEIGRLELTGLVSDQAGGCEARVFDPTVVTDGIECSDDPVLHARSRAYSVSLALRKGLRRPGAAAADASSAPDPGGMRVTTLAGRQVALASVHGRVYGFDDVCTHRGCSLAQGTLEGVVVTCPCHGSQFDVTTGAVVRGPATEPVATYAVEPST